MRRSLCLYLAAVTSAVFFASLHAAAPTVETSVSVLNSWLPLVLLASLLGVGITLIYYIIGYLLNNRRIKANAISEYSQALGTVAMVIIILMVLNFYGSTFYAVLSSLPQGNVNKICGQLDNANILLVGNIEPPTLVSPSTVTPTNTICSSLISKAGKTDATANLDYGLASTYLITANLTEQISENINAVYIFEGYTNYLSALQPISGACLPELFCLQNGVQNLQASGTSQIPDTWQVMIAYLPYSAYTVFRGVMFSVLTQATMMFYMFQIQLLAILFALFAWPYLLAAGVILRASFLTRRLGGLLIAIALASVIIYPTIYLFEYVSLTCPTTGSCSRMPITGAPTTSILGSPPSPSSPSVIPVLYLNGTPPGDSSCPRFTDKGTPCVDYAKNINFYVFPNAESIINYYGCWPIPFGSSGGSNLLQQELLDAGSYLVPGYSQYLALTALIGNVYQSVPKFLTYNLGCDPKEVINTLFGLEQMYGIISVIGIVLPILNILLTLASLKGLSSLFGGDTFLLGLGRLI